MKTAAMHAAKTTLTHLAARAEAGEEIILARGDQPVAKIALYRPTEPPRRFGVKSGTSHRRTSTGRAEILAWRTGDP